MPEPAYLPKVDERVFVLREKPDKLHEQFVVKPCLSSLLPEILNTKVAADDLIVDATVDISDDSATVVWSDAITTIQPVDSVRTTTAYSRFMKLTTDAPRT
ncbi:hypothetical protein P9112_003041 [Eukaryota sp. TZLM1-RC]